MNIGDPFLSLKAIGARRPVVVVTITELIPFLLAQKTRPNGRLSSPAALRRFFRIMRNVRGLTHCVTRLVTMLSARGDSLDGPTYM